MEAAVSDMLAPSYGNTISTKQGNLEVSIRGVEGRNPHFLVLFPPISQQACGLLWVGKPPPGPPKFIPKATGGSRAFKHH